MDVSISQIVQLSDSAPNSDTDASTDTSIATTPLGSGTPTGSVVVQSRDRSGTIIARPVWDRPPPTTTTTTATANARRSPPSTDISRGPDTETEDDGDADADIDMDRGRIDDSDVASASASPSPERPPRRLPLPLGVGGVGRRAVGIVTDDPATGAPPDMGGLDTDAHIIINDAGAGEVVGEVGVEGGIVSLEANDDFAMGAPPGAPGAINAAEGGTPRGMNLGEGGGRRRGTNPNVGMVEAPDVTPRAGVVGLPMMVGGNTTIRGPPAPTTAPAAQAQAVATQHQRNATIRGGRVTNPDALGPRTDAGAIAAAIARTGGGGVGNNGITTTTTTNATMTTNNNHNNGGGHHARDTDSSGPYRDEDVLLSLQLLAYLSKYPHVRQAFYKPRVTFHPASLGLTGGARYGVGAGGRFKEKEKEKEGGKEKEKEGKEKEKEREGGKGGKEGFFRAFANVASGSGRGGKERERANPPPHAQSPSASSSSVSPSSGLTANASSSSPHTTTTSPSTTSPPLRQTNVFSLVERFTFKPSSTETDLPNPPPRLPPEIQYWAGVIMRNACRKDDSRGGIRQCANSEFFFVFGLLLVAFFFFFVF
jgi:hypothetical protein